MSHQPIFSYNTQKSVGRSISAQQSMLKQAEIVILGLDKNSIPFAGYRGSGKFSKEQKSQIEELIGQSLSRMREQFIEQLKVDKTNILVHLKEINDKIEGLDRAIQNISCETQNIKEQQQSQPILCRKQMEEKIQGLQDNLTQSFYGKLAESDNEIKLLINERVHLLQEQINQFVKSDPRTVMNEFPQDKVSQEKQENAISYANEVSKYKLACDKLSQDLQSQQRNQGKLNEELQSDLALCRKAISKTESSNALMESQLKEICANIKTIAGKYDEISQEKYRSKLDVEQGCEGTSEIKQTSESAPKKNAALPEINQIQIQLAHLQNGILSIRKQLLSYERQGLEIQAGRMIEEQDASEQRAPLFTFNSGEGSLEQKAEFNFEQYAKIHQSRPDDSQGEQISRTQQRAANLPNLNFEVTKGMSQNTSNNCPDGMSTKEATPAVSFVQSKAPQDHNLGTSENPQYTYCAQSPNNQNSSHGKAVQLLVQANQSTEAIKTDQSETLPHKFMEKYKLEYRSPTKKGQAILEQSNKPLPSTQYQSPDEHKRLLKEQEEFVQELEVHNKKLQEIIQQQQLHSDHTGDSVGKNSNNLQDAKKKKKRIFDKDFSSESNTPRQLKVQIQQSVKAETGEKLLRYSKDDFQISYQISNVGCAIKKCLTPENLKTETSDLVEIGTKRGDNFESFQERMQFMNDELISLNVYEKIEEETIKDIVDSACQSECSQNDSQIRLKSDNAKPDVQGGGERMNTLESQTQQIEEILNKTAAQKDVDLLQFKEFEKLISPAHSTRSVQGYNTAEAGDKSNLYESKGKEFIGSHEPEQSSIDGPKPRGSVRARKSKDDQPDEEQEEIVYQIDEQGFLMDEQGNYILDDSGQMIKLSEQHIEYLRSSNMLEEQVIQESAQSNCQNSSNNLK